MRVVVIIVVIIVIIIAISHRQVRLELLEGEPVVGNADGLGAVQN
jgi:hypothetical protein